MSLYCPTFIEWTCIKGRLLIEDLLYVYFLPSWSYDICKTKKSVCINLTEVMSVTLRGIELPFVVGALLQFLDYYSTLSNKRAGWNKMCRLENSAKIGNFKNLKLNWMGLKYF